MAKFHLVWTRIELDEVYPSVKVYLHLKANEGP